MPERNPPRTGSRRNTPQPGPQPSRTTRATRSQSRDLNESDLPRYSERVQRRPNKSASRSAEPDSTTDRKRVVPEQTNLTTVNEDPSVVIENEAMEADQEQLPSLDAKSSGRVSGISGTTARLSSSTQELAELALEDVNVLDALPDLLESSSKFLRGLLPEEISSNVISKLRSALQDKRSGLTRSRKRFAVDLESCHPDHSSSTFVDISKALPTLYETWDDPKVGSDTITAVFRAANLAILASNILLYPQQEDMSFLQNLDSNFPIAFSNDRDGHYLSIFTRIQYAIEQLDKHRERPNFDHDLVLNQIFNEEDGRTLRGYNSPAGKDIAYRNVLSSTHEEIRRMRDIWDEDSPSSPIERLKDVYVWSEYATDMMIYLTGKYQEVKAVLDTIETDDIIFSLKTALQDMTKAKQTSSGDGSYDTEAEAGRVDLSSYSPPSKPSGATGQADEHMEKSSIRAKELAGSGYLKLGSPRLAHGAKSMKRAMARHLNASKPIQQADNSEVVSVAVPAATVSEPKSDQVQLTHSASANIHRDPESVNDHNGNEWTPQANGDDGDLELHEDEEGDDEEGDDAFQTQQTHHQNAERALRLHETREAESNKENQAGPSQPQPKKHMTDPQVGAQKATWPESQDVSQDEGFQQSHQRPSTGRGILQPINKRSAPDTLASTQRSPAKRARFQALSINDGDDDDEAQDPRQAPRISQVYNLANSAAKQMTALQPKAPQIRKPWSEEETERLLDLIEEFGTSWKQLKHEDQNDGILGHRDQVALKDKARNMKFDFLKAGTMLPRHFDKIALSKLLIDKLRGLEIVYDAVTGMREDAEA